MTRHALGELSDDDFGVLWSMKPPRGVLIGTYDDAARAYHIAQDIDCAKDEWEGRRP